MRPFARARFEAASALSMGMRAYQEDAVIADFPLGADLGFVVLSDGMGGHAAGDIASKIVMTEVYSELKFQSGSPDVFEAHTGEMLRAAVVGANECLRAHVERNPKSAGMGATVVAAVLNRQRLHWISVGDSPLFLFRDGELIQLNEDHSMAPQIDFMVDSGLMDSETGAHHPDRNALTSVLAGEPIARIDCPDAPLEMQDGDILIAASDGLQFLGDAEIEEVLGRTSEASSTEIAETLLEELSCLDDPDQDNVSMTVVKIQLQSTDRIKTVIREPTAEPVVQMKPKVRTAPPMPAEPEAQQVSTGRLTLINPVYRADGAK